MQNTISIKKFILIGFLIILSGCIVERQYYIINNKGDTLRVKPIQDSVRPRPIEHLIF